MRPAHRVPAAASAAGSALLAWPQAAHAHGIVGRRDLPIPEETFFVASAGVLIVSFVGLAFAWKRPHLQEPGGVRLIPFAPAASAGLQALGGVLGVALFALVVYAGLAGTETATANLAPTAIFVLFWVGLVPLSLLFGDVFRWLSPWRALGRFTGWVGARVTGGEGPAPLEYPRWLGYWPAAAGLLAFTWVELVYSKNDEPFTLAVLALIYAAVQLLGASLFGTERWTARGDAFAVYFNLFSRLSPLEWRENGLYGRKPLAGLSTLPLLTGSVALLCVMIGTTAFDGAREGDLWGGIAPDLQSFFTDLGFGQSTALEAAFTVGLVGGVLLVALVYGLGVLGMKAVAPGSEWLDLARAFMPTLVPIAAAYVIAHYFSLLMYQGQAIGFLISDPLGEGSDIFGTADESIDYGVVSATDIWWVQVGSLVIGHVVALALAHDRALARWSSLRTATISQMWMLVVMVGFTLLGLYLLSSAAS